MTSAAAPSPSPLLGYVPFTAPSPIPISTPNVAAQAIIDLVVTVPTSPVYCDELLIAVPTGTTADTLCAQTPTLAVNTAMWSISTMMMRSGNDLGLEDDLNYTTWTCQTVNAADNAITYPLVFRLVATVNQAGGTCNLVVQETSGTTSDPTTYTPKNSTIPLSKAAPQFYLNNFMATAPGSPLVPVSEFANGAPMYFSWESNGNYFQLFAKNNPTPLYSGTLTNFTLSAGAATDTTFILVACETNDPASGGSNGFTPLYLYDTLTITITNEDGTPNSLQVADYVTVGGTLGVTGALTASAMVSANNGLTVGNGATVTGGATVDTLTATGSGTVNGVLTANGTLVINPPSGVQIGDWSIMQDPGTGNLNFNNNGVTQLSLTPAGVMSTGGNQVVCLNQSLMVQSIGNSGYLATGIDGTQFPAAYFFTGANGTTNGWSQMMLVAYGG